MLQPNLNLLVTAGEDVLTRSSDERRPTEAPEKQENPFDFTPQLLRLHKDHELFEDGDIQRHLSIQDLFISEAEDTSALSVSEFGCHISGCSAVFSTLDDYEHHYNSLHRHVCCSCRCSLPTARLLDIHIQEWHDSLFTVLAQRQDMYQCLVEGCGQQFRTSKQRKDHLIMSHKYPPDFRFDKNKKGRGTKEAKRQQQKNTAMEVVGVVRESQGVCEIISDDPEEEQSMETHVSSEEGAAAQSSETNTAQIKPQYSHRVPPTVCFGHGSIRGFRGGRSRRK
uniref:Zinc finger protein 511 n=1 Tax=Nothobranchius rachovii TaxID=451742 RepID=A0A1A8S5D0_9TELE